MKHSRIAVFLILVLASAALAAPAPQTLPVRPANNALAAQGFDELYNADYDPAIRDFTRLQSQFPDDPFPSNYLLAALLFKELNRIGALDSETYSSPRFLTSNGDNRPRQLDLDAQHRIFDLISHVEAITNARLEKNPNDADALYARGVARGFRSTYMGMAQKSWVPAIRAALASRRDHERVLALDPSYVDAKMTVGIHLYIVGSLNWAGRAMVALVGVTGNRQKGLDYLREVSRAHGTSSADAAMALSLFLRREERYPEALDLVARMTGEFPRNFLLANEFGHLLNAAGRGHEAIEQYHRVLDTGRAGKYSSFQPELTSWGLAISLRGQHEFATAAQAFDDVAAVKEANPVLVARATLCAGQMYDTLGQRDKAVAHYRRLLASAMDDESGDTAAAARRALKHPYLFHDLPSPRYMP
jgi:tetratricopeptide (TPR) repeat protein